MESFNEHGRDEQMGKYETDNFVYPGPRLCHGRYLHGEGISVLDHFAGQAMTGMLAHSTRYKPRAGAPENWHDAIAEEAYEVAEAMMRVRRK